MASLVPRINKPVVKSASETEVKQLDEKCQRKSLRSPKNLGDDTLITNDMYEKYGFKGELPEISGGQHISYLIMLREDMEPTSIMNNSILIGMSLSTDRKYLIDAAKGDTEFPEFIDVYQCPEELDIDTYKQYLDQSICNHDTRTFIIGLLATGPASAVNYARCVAAIMLRLLFKDSKQLNNKFLNLALFNSQFFQTVEEHTPTTPFSLDSNKIEACRNTFQKSLYRPAVAKSIIESFLLSEFKGIFYFLYIVSCRFIGFGVAKALISAATNCNCDVNTILKGCNDNLSYTEVEAILPVLHALLPLDGDSPSDAANKTRVSLLGMIKDFVCENVDLNSFPRISSFCLGIAQGRQPQTTFLSFRIMSDAYIQEGLDFYNGRSGLVEAGTILADPARQARRENRLKGAPEPEDWSFK